MQVNKIDDGIDFINTKSKPLAAYLFTNNKKLKEEFVSNISAGAVVINDVTLHVLLLNFNQNSLYYLQSLIILLYTHLITSLYFLWLNYVACG